MSDPTRPRRAQRGVPAVWMRGGTSKGVFFHAADLPADPAERDALLLRALGSPDPYGQQIDGLGGATSSTSKVVLIAPSERPDCDVDYRFGHVSITDPVIDYSGNCGNLTAAVGPFAIEEGLVRAQEGMTEVRIWQANIGKRIIARVPVRDGEPVVDGDFRLDGVPWPGAAVELSFLDPGGSAEAPLLPTGQACEQIEVPGVGVLAVSLINAGNPTVFVRAADLGLDGREQRATIDGDPALLDRLERIRAHCAVRMGLGETPEAVSRARPATPKLAWVAPAADYRDSTGASVPATRCDLLARILSMGRLHHAFTGTGAVALAVAAALPGTLVNALTPWAGEHGVRHVRIGHPAGVLEVGAEVVPADAGWTARRAIMRRSARRLMEGRVLVPW
ncbi:2-methylaconitate cis-trans isomerase PrpF [Marichromatium sp. AB32]|uniref:2-methylaconitate cis-trans isomerase PrpF n=1 Tax=Marichromatium sp. AB32 TaxID=2483363 RepID=UPI000F3AF8C8|nr:2-methylaconitate cis-trans isomerase PrpF [Marichromatium sp. AB32]RNE93614.1 2-methylaconitate cis-trans isomerase PrpF [Marichromatium sp. AB32]